MSVSGDASHGELRARRDRALLHATWSGSVVRVVTAVLGAVTIGIAVRHLGDERYGVVGTLGTMVGLLGFADFGIGQGLLTTLARARGEGDDLRMRHLVSSSFAALLAIGAVVTVVGVVLALFVPWQQVLGAEAVPKGQVVAGVLVFVVAVGAAIPATVGARVLIGLQRGALVSVWQLAAAILTLLAVVACGAADAPLAYYVAATVGVPVLVNLVQSAWVFVRMHPELRPRRIHVRRITIREIVGLSGLFFGLNLAVAFAYQADSIIVAAVKGAASAAVFVVALRLFTLVTGLFSGASQQMWPALAEAMARGDLAWARSRFVWVTAGAVGVSTAVCAVLVAIGPWVIRVLAGPSVVPSRWLLLAFAAWTVYSLGMAQASNVLNAARKVRPQLIMALLVAGTNLPLSIWLTHVIGLPGPLVGSLVSHIVFAGVPTALLTRRLLWAREPVAVG